jgi:hypothetical protein
MGKVVLYIAHLQPEFRSVAIANRRPRRGGGPKRSFDLDVSGETLTTASRQGCRLTFNDRPLRVRRFQQGFERR